MEKVTGIGGFFFRSKSPSELNDWYERNLGIHQCPQAYEDSSWWQDEGPTVFGAEDDATIFGRPEQS